MFRIAEEQRIVSIRCGHCHNVITIGIEIDDMSVEDIELMQRVSQNTPTENHFDEERAEFACSGKISRDWFTTLGCPLHPSRHDKLPDDCKDGRGEDYIG